MQQVKLSLEFPNNFIFGLRLHCCNDSGIYEQNLTIMIW